MAKITYADKVKTQDPAAPVENLWRDLDANEVKASVNALYDNIVVSPAIAMSDESSDLDHTAPPINIYIIENQMLSEVVAAVNVAPTDSSVIVDVLLNNASIGVVNILDGSLVGSLIISQVLSVGDWLTFDLTQEGATIKGAGLKSYTKSRLIIS